MSNPQLSPDQVSNLIDHILKVKDPATIGLKRIIRKKALEYSSFPLKQHEYEQFDTPEQQKGIFKKDEVAVLETEKKIHLLQAQLAQEKENSRKSVEQAYRKGYEEGQAKGVTEARADADKNYQARLTEIEKRIATILNDVSRSRKGLLISADRSILELSLLCAKKIIQSEISVNSDIVLSVIKKALGFISDRETLVVRVAQDDLETVTEKKSVWADIGERLDGIKISADPRIEKGGCIIESQSGVADARTGVLFDELRDVIEKTWDSLHNNENDTAGK